MDMFGLGKTKGKRKLEVTLPMVATKPTNAPSPPSPTTPPLHPTHTISHSSTTTYSLPSIDSDVLTIDTLSDSELQDMFERMLSRRGIHDTHARGVMLAFPTEKKRLMVTQDIQAEAGLAMHTPPTRRGASADRIKEAENSPEYYVRKLSDPGKNSNSSSSSSSSKLISHLAVRLRTMPLSWVRQFIEMNGLLIMTDVLGSLNRVKHKRENEVFTEGEILKCFKALLNNRVSEGDRANGS
ncbi:diaphanous GTPase-binding domain-containing protein [Spinellus fusiger]|nr:diaphanous GTPase-binding domain-containing protein [Spinellus fusiger]